jgi:Zn-finger nucleic acid-binding protein
VQSIGFDLTTRMATAHKGRNSLRAARSHRFRRKGVVPVKCPVCPESTLAMSERQGVEIDYCPNCRGVWLDRGELDKLVEMSARQSPAVAAAPVRGAPPPFADSDYGEHRGYGHKRRKSWLGEIFD